MTVIPAFKDRGCLVRPVNAADSIREAPSAHKENPSSAFVFSSRSCPFYSRARPHLLHVREPGLRPALPAHGIRSVGGFGRRSAFTVMSRWTGIGTTLTGSAHGRRIRAAFSSSPLPGCLSAAVAMRGSGRRGSSSTGRISSGGVTAAVGPNGARDLCAGFDHPTTESEVTK